MIRRHPDIAAVSFLLLIAVVIMVPYLLSPYSVIWPRSGLGTDFMHYHWTAMHYMRESLHENGQIPLWYGDTMGGSPIVGNPGITSLYPLEFGMMLLPLPILLSFTILTTLHLWIAGIGGYELTRRALRLRRSTALIGGLAIMLTPRLSSNMVGDIGLAYSMAWTPLVMAWAWLGLDRRSWRWAIPAGMGLAFQYILHIQIFFLTSWVIGLYYFYGITADLKTRRASGIGPWVRIWLAQTAVLILVVITCVGLVAFNLLPFSSYLPELSRETLSLSEANHYTLPPLMLITSLMPNPLKFPEWELYAGLIPLVLAPLAWSSPKRRMVTFWIALIVFAALFSLGTTTPVFTLLYKFIPGFSWLRVPPRMWYFVEIALVMLTAMVIDHLLDRPTVQRQAWIWRWATFLILITIAGRYFTRRPHQADWLLGFVGAIGLVLALIALQRWQQGRISANRLIAALVIGLLLDLIPVDMAYMGPRPQEEVLEVPAIAEPLLDQTGLFRIYSVRHEIPDYVALNEDLQIVDGMSSFQFEVYIQYAKLASGCTLPGFSATVPPCMSNEISKTAYQDAVPNPALLGMFNVQYLITPLETTGDAWTLLNQDEDERLYENADVMPRAFAVGTVESVPDREAVWDHLPEIDLRTAALVEGSENLDLPQNEFYVPADRIERTANEIRVRITVPNDGMLILGEVYTPGWSATDNGKDVNVERVNGAMRGVYLGAGEHEIVFTYSPTLFWIGLAITGITILACTAALVIGRQHSH
jgi:hypothetical protein